MRPNPLIFSGVCLALLLHGAPASAQVLIGYLFGEKLSTPNFNMGFEVGANFSNFQGLGHSERTNAALFGLFADWRFSEHIHLGGAVLPFAGRGAQDLAPVSTGDPGFDSQITDGTMKRSVSYVEIPVLLEWAPQMQQGFRAGAGPSFGLVTGGTDRYTVTTASGMHYVLERDIGNQLPGLDLGVSLGAEWRFNLLSIGVRYTQGLSDMSLDGTSAVHSRALAGSARIYLGKKTSPGAP